MTSEKLPVSRDAFVQRHKKLYRTDSGRESVVNVGWPADATVYKVLTDWGSFIAGIVALLAGIIAYIGALRAARTQVRAVFAAIERPAIFVEATRACWHTSHLPNIPFIEYNIHNHGRTAAIIKSRKISAVVVEKIPTVAPCENAKRLSDQTSIVANGALKDLTETVYRGDDTDKLESVRTRARILLFSGVIEYEDPFGGHQFVARFGWIFEPSDPAIPHSNERFLACDIPGYNVNT